MSHGLILRARSTFVTPFQRVGLWVVKAAPRGPSTAWYTIRLLLDCVLRKS